MKAQASLRNPKKSAALVPFMLGTPQAGLMLKGRHSKSVPPFQCQVLKNNKSPFANHQYLLLAIGDLLFELIGEENFRRGRGGASHLCGKWPSLP
jgi:hypothetical protein